MSKELLEKLLSMTVEITNPEQPSESLATHNLIQCTLEMPFEREYTLRSWQQEIMSVIDDSDKL